MIYIGNSLTSPIGDWSAVGCNRPGALLKVLRALKIAHERVEDPARDHIVRADLPYRVLAAMRDATEQAVNHRNIPAKPARKRLDILV
jgi:hypothetical protein